MKRLLSVIMKEKNNSKININTIIGAETEVMGAVTAKGNIKIDGTVNGNVTIDGELIVGEQAFIKGNIIAESVLVSGVVEGNVTCADNFTVMSTAQVKGDVVTNGILVDAGSKFEGRCEISE